MPSSTAIVWNSRATAPAAATCSATRSPRFFRCTCPGTNCVYELAIATIGLPRSLSATPVARNSARAAALFRPASAVAERRTGIGDSWTAQRNAARAAARVADACDDTRLRRREAAHRLAAGRRSRSDAVAQLRHAGRLGAVIAAEHPAVGLEAVADDPAAAVAAGGCEDRDRAFEAVERVGPARHHDVEGLVVLVSAFLAALHRSTPVRGTPSAQGRCP